VVLRRRDGSEFNSHIRARLILDGEGRPAAVVWLTVDISERVATERAVAASRDYAQAIAHSMGEGLFALDEDGRVTYINPAAEQLLGYPHGELDGQVMHNLVHGRRTDGSLLALEDCPIMQAMSGGAVARVDEDEFMTRSGRMLAVGYTAAPFTGEDAGRGCVVIFRDNSETKRLEDERRHDVETLAWLERVEAALAEDRLVLYAQPLVELASGRTVGHELLLRMRERDGSIVTPASFLPIAERFALIGEIDWWVIKRGIQIASEGTPVELNVSARSVGDVDVLEHVERCLDEYAPAAGSVVFELTETSLMEDEGGARRFAERVRALGCGVALDDFGTGYAGLSYLKQLPVDMLKIDIEFVRDLCSNKASRNVVQAVIALARDFGLRTVAEGVEDAATLELLAELGVDSAQGFYIAEPAPFACRPGDSSRPPHVAARALWMAVRASAAAVH
jgi:PAS domain S-box-containing protein